ncbi:MAG: DUF1761 domain-containing protein [Emcibacteraceae bacterium]|nr:DUF1761 domain-containing protein [Emcibacteraceae bacterium]
MLSFTELNFLAIILATIAKFMVGGLWFSKILFGAAWLQEVGLKEEELGSPKNALMIGFGTCLLVVFSMAVLFQIMALDLRTALAVTVIMALGITSAQFGLAFAFEGKSLKLFLIYATQCVAEFVVVALILNLM